MQLKIPKPQRPIMGNYGIAATDEGLMAWTWVRDEMTKSRNYWICTTRPDGRPHAAPVWGVVVDDVIYFGSAKSAVKARNLSHNPQVVVHLESGDDCVIVEGEVFSVDDMSLLERIAADYGKKYVSFTPSAGDLHSETGVTYGVAPQIVMAWKESDFPNTATRWVFER
ncbi:MAG: pyridoxamine 5'-phosphate oxidase [Chloroflexi bacterium]|nr:MAG: pyridoxamine 5'-phosphate oxidase [Chloroflexota bacterium]